MPKLHLIALTCLLVAAACDTTGRDFRNGDTTAGDTGTTGLDTGACSPPDYVEPPIACACDPIEKPDCGLGLDCVPTGDLEVPHACLSAWTHDCFRGGDLYTGQILNPVYPYGFPGKPYCPICMNCASSESTVLQCQQ